VGIFLQPVERSVMYIGLGALLLIILLVIILT
jgi:hypothetical protein